MIKILAIVVTYNGMKWIDILAYRSLRPMHWFFYILFHYPSILRNKRVSEKESTAFLYS